MGLALVIPALVIPLALAAAIAACRQLAAAAGGLLAEIRAMQQVAEEARATGVALRALDRPRREGPTPDR